MAKRNTLTVQPKIDPFPRFWSFGYLGQNPILGRSVALGYTGYYVKFIFFRLDDVDFIHMHPLSPQSPS